MFAPLGLELGKQWDRSKEALRAARREFAKAAAELDRARSACDRAE
jgi:hypothetical protein